MRNTPKLTAEKKTVELVKEKLLSLIIEKNSSL